MKTASGLRPIAQGDALLVPIKGLPGGLRPAQPTKTGHHILAHSETGHHHVIDSRAADMFIDEMNEFAAYLRVNETALLEHQRSFDTHEPIQVPPGLYAVRRQREYVPEGFRRAAD